MFFRAATQIEKIKDVADIILDEPDTCPQNRYSTSASMVHAHLSGTILEGAHGAKHWITRLADYEPQSGVAYRKILKKYSKFYNVLADTVKGIKWNGFRIPLLGTPKFVFGDFEETNITENHWGAAQEQPNGWANCVIERFGLPMYSLIASIILEGAKNASSVGSINSQKLLFLAIFINSS